MTNNWIEHAAKKVAMQVRWPGSEMIVTKIITEAYAECEAMKILKRTFEICDRLEIMNVTDIPQNAERDELRQERGELRIAARRLVEKEGK